MPSAQACPCGANPWQVAAYRLPSSKPVLTSHLRCLRKLQVGRAKIWVSNPFIKSPQKLSELVDRNPISMGLWSRDPFIPIRYLGTKVHTPKIHTWFDKSPRRSKILELRKTNPNLKMETLADGQFVIEPDFWQKLPQLGVIGSEAYDYKLKSFWDPLVGPKLVIAKNKSQLEWFRKDILRIAGIRGLRYTCWATVCKYDFPQVQHVILLARFQSARFYYNLRHGGAARFMRGSTLTHRAKIRLEGLTLQFGRCANGWISAKSKLQIGQDVSAQFLQYMQQTMDLRGKSVDLTSRL